MTPEYRRVRRKMGANQVTFRPATLSDCRIIAELFCIASEGVSEYVWAQLKSDPEYADLDLIDIGTKRFEREDANFSYQSCDIAEIDGEPVGMLHAYEMGSDVGNPPDDIDPVLRPYAELEEPNSLYIAGLAMFDNYRGQGIGTRLLDYAYKRTRAQGLKKTSLIVFADNEDAFDLYRREGFEEVARRPVVPHPIIRHTGDALLMVRRV